MFVTSVSVNTRRAADLDLKPNSQPSLDSLVQFREFRRISEYCVHSIYLFACSWAYIGLVKTTAADSVVADQLAGEFCVV